MSSIGPRWQIIIQRSAKRVLRRLPRDVVERISIAIEALADNPRPPDSRKLVGYDLYRIRVGDWRIIYALENDQLIIVVVEIGARGQVYRDL